MPLLADPRYTQSAIAGGVNSGLMATAAPEEEPPPVLDVLASAARNSTLAGAAYRRVTQPDPDLPDAPPGWDPLDHIQGYEGYAHKLADAATPSDLAGMLQRIRDEETDRQVLARAGLGGAGTEIAMNILDPTFLVAVAIPELAVVKAGRIGSVARGAIEGVATAAAYEGGMQALQESRTAQESLFGVGAGALLGGILGGVLHQVPKKELDVSRETIALDEAIVPESMRSTGGAAARVAESTAAREGLARGDQTLSRTMAKAPLLGTDLDRVMATDSVLAKQTLQDLADIPGLLGKNLEGEATPISVEAMVGRHEARLANFSDTLRDQWLEYKKRVTDKPMTEGDFRVAVASAARRGDKSEVPEVSKAAAFLRDNVFDPLKKDAMDLGLLDDPVKLAQQAAEKKAVESYVKAETKQIYANYRAKVEKAASELAEGEKKPRILSRRRFVQRAEKAARAGAVDDTAEINQLVKLMRDQEAGTLGKRVVVPKVDERYLQRVVGAESYFRRMYDRDVIRANLQEWRGTLRLWFQRSGEKVGPEEIDAAIEDVTRKILGADVGQANFATKISVPKAGPLQERTLDIPDHLIEKFLVSDPMKVANAYVRELAPQVEMARKFGDVDMSQQIQSISDDYAIKRKQVEQSKRSPENKAKELERISKDELEAKEALVRIRDRILGRAGRLGPDASEGTRRAVNAARAWRNWVAAARLGGTAITGGTMDLARISAQYGFLPTMRKLTKLATSKDFRDLSRAQARRVGSAVEVALSRRVVAAYEGAVTEGWSQTLANGVYKYTGLNHLTDFNRTLSATLFEDAVLKAARKVADGGQLKTFDRGRLASLGLGDDELRRIAQQVEEHGGEVDGVRVSGSADWLDKDLADIYDAAILKESKIVVQQPGAADRVWWMDSEIGKFIGQLKSFGLSAPARMLSQPLQAFGAGRFGYGARFIGYMMIGGYLTHMIRQLVAGKKPVTDPASAANEALTESGALGIIPDLVSPVGRRLGFGESVRMSDRNVMSAYGGPALGFAGDVYDFAMNRTQGGMSASDLHMLRRMLPYNNVWFLRREINALEGELAEAMNLNGADSASVIERISRTDAVRPAGERGGTGTGVIP